MRKRLKQGILSTICERRVRGYADLSLCVQAQFSVSIIIPNHLGYVASCP